MGKAQEVGQTDEEVFFFAFRDFGTSKRYREELIIGGKPKEGLQTGEESFLFVFFGAAAVPQRRKTLFRETHACGLTDAAAHHTPFTRRPLGLPPRQRLRDATGNDPAASCQALPAASRPVGTPESRQAFMNFQKLTRYNVVGTSHHRDLSCRECSANL